jgi:hypothetical protein
VACADSGRQKLQSILRSDGPGFARGLLSSCSCVEHSHLRNHRVKNPSGRADDDLAAHVRPFADESVRGAAGHKHQIPRAQLQQATIDTEVIVTFTDDERFVISGMAVLTSPRFWWLNGFAECVCAPVFITGCLESHAHSAHLVCRALARLEVGGLTGIEHLLLQLGGSQ